MVIESFNQIMFVSNYLIIIDQILHMRTRVPLGGLNKFPECFIISDFNFGYATKVTPYAFSSNICGYATKVRPYAFSRSDTNLFLCFLYNFSFSRRI